MPFDADNSSGSITPAACIDWRNGDADSMSARTTSESTIDAGYTTAGLSLLPQPSVSYLYFGGRWYGRLLPPNSTVHISVRQFGACLLQVPRMRHSAGPTISSRSIVMPGVMRSSSYRRRIASSHQLETDSFQKISVIPAR